MAHPVTDALAGVTDPTQRQAIKVAAFVALPNVVNVVTVGVYTVTLVARPVRGPEGMLEFHVKITKGGKDVTPATWVGPDGKPGHVRVPNPPLWVPDPAGDIVRTYTDLDGTVITQNYREDLHAALLNIAGRLVALLP